MRKKWFLLAASLAAALAAALTIPAYASPVVVDITRATGAKVAGQYIVTLASGTPVGTTASALSAEPLFTYRAAMHGFAARLSSAQLTALQHNPRVVRIEEDAVAHATTTQTSPTWGLDRIDERALPLSGSYTYNHTGSPVRAYIIDTGIATSHPDFGGRASNVKDTVGDGRNGQDCNGHGTHVSGTVGGTKYGVAKKVLLRGVRVLNCQGSGSYSQVIAGIDWVTGHAVKPAVANMSLGGGYSSSVNSAATKLANSGVFLAVAAGNSGASACNYSPSSASNVTAVAASDKTDTRASFSNYGSCVDAYAPGVSVKSDWLNGSTNTISGTSMASPHVCGVAALYKHTYGDKASSTINTWIIDNSTKSVIKSNPSGTPNRLLYKSSL